MAYQADLSFKHQYLFLTQSQVDRFLTFKIVVYMKIKKSRILVLILFYGCNNNENSKLYEKYTDIKDDKKEIIFETPFTRECFFSRKW